MGAVSKTAQASMGGKVRQIRNTVLHVFYDAAGKQHKRFIQDVELFTEVDGRLAQGGGRK